jgi:stage II sporulation protein M
LFLLAPHGIFELPAVFIAIGFGLKLGVCSLRMIISGFDKKENKFFAENLINSFRSFFLVIVPLLVIAGIIEAVLIRGF